jgi:hypothetical protein
VSLVGSRVFADLLFAEGFAGDVLARGITDQAGEITYQEHGVMAQILELAQLVDEHRMPQVQIRRGGVEARLDPQGPARPELLCQVPLEQDLVGTASELI